MTALRARAARDVLFRAGFFGLWAKRSGRGVLTDLMVRMVTCEGFESGAAAWGIRGSNDRVDDGRRKGGGRRPQLRGALGGILLAMRRFDGLQSPWLLSQHIFGEGGGPSVPR